MEVMRHPHFLCLHRFLGQEFLPATVLNGTDEIYRTYHPQKGEKNGYLTFSMVDASIDPKNG